MHSPSWRSLLGMHPSFDDEEADVRLSTDLLSPAPGVRKLVDAAVASLDALDVEIADALTDAPRRSEIEDLLRAQRHEVERAAVSRSRACSYQSPRAPLVCRAGASRRLLKTLCPPRPQGAAIAKHRRKHEHELRRVVHAKDEERNAAVEATEAAYSSNTNLLAKPGYVSPITVKRKVDEALRHAEARHRKALQSIVEETRSHVSFAPRHAVPSPRRRLPLTTRPLPTRPSAKRRCRSSAKKSS